MNNNKIENLNYKYICEKCDYKCRFDCEWKKHCETTLHLTGKRKKKDNYKQALKCDKCEYTTKNKTTMIKHTLNEHATKVEREKEFKFYCSYCDFGTFSKDTIEIHNNTNKHKKYQLRIKK
jgi:hypothetical protein